MKIAVPATIDNQIDGHFGHCEHFNIITVNSGKIEGIEKLESPQECGCKSNIAGLLAEKGVTLMLAGGIGGGAINVLNSVGIDVVRGCAGDVTEVVNEFLKGNVADSGSTCAQHQCEH
jgi:predicted Fe-Mo cluster-binding NifX family protein